MYITRQFGLRGHADETPAVYASVGQPFTISGWVLDPSASAGTGIDSVQVVRLSESGLRHPGRVPGLATLGGSRPAVDAQFANAAMPLTITRKPAGTYLVTVSVRTTATGTYVTRQFAIYVDTPTAAVTIDRWALEPAR